MDRLRRILKPRLGIMCVWVLGFIFFAHNMHMQLASDDLAWLRGEAPTVFDQYRLIPRLLFILLYRLAGPNPAVALAVIFIFHSANMLFVVSLAFRFWKDSLASVASAWIFMINPLTLSTLTWISCFSYILGTSMALLAILFFCRGCSSSRALLWQLAAVACYGIGLFCSHELLFLPVIFFLLGWLYGGRSFVQTSLVSGSAMLLGLLTNNFFYNFESYGVETARLFHLDFASVFTSSALSIGVSLGAAYLVSFFVFPESFLQFVFSEPVRWGITLLLLTGALFLHKPDKGWRNWLSLALSFVALITPFILRLYLMPSSVNYDISYVLSGRVFYLSFVLIAIVGGALIAQVFRACANNRMLRLLAQALPVPVYLFALCVLYSPKDFMGLSVLSGASQSFPLPWNPYYENQPVWLASLLIVPLVAYMRQIFELGSD